MRSPGFICILFTFCLRVVFYASDMQAAENCPATILNVEYTSYTQTKPKYGFDEFTWFEGNSPRRIYAKKRVTENSEYHSSVHDNIAENSTWSDTFSSTYQRDVRFTSWVRLTVGPVPSTLQVKYYRSFPSQGVEVYAANFPGSFATGINTWTLVGLPASQQVPGMWFTSAGDFQGVAHGEIEQLKTQTGQTIVYYNTDGTGPFVTVESGVYNPLTETVTLIPVSATSAFQTLSGIADIDNLIAWHTLIDEYTDDELRTYVTSVLEQGMQGTLADAFCKWSPDHASLTLRKVKMKISFIGRAGNEYDISWLERFTPLNGGSVTASRMTERVRATGELQVLERDIIPPSQEGSITAEIIPNAPCANCGPGMGLVSNNSVDVLIDLGTTSNGDSAGSLYVNEKPPSALLATRRTLRFNGFGRPEIEVIKTPESGSPELYLRQVKTSKIFADIVTLSSTKYQVKLYPGSAVTDANHVPGTEYVSIIGSPYLTWTFESTDGGNSLNVQRQLTFGSDTDASLFVWDGTKQNWRLERASTRKEVRTKTVSGALRTEVLEITDWNNVVKYREKLEFTTFSGIGERLTKKVVGEDNDFPLTTQFFYYQTGSNAGKLQKVVEPSGFWQQYSYDTQGRTTKIVSQFLNLPQLSQGTSETSCRVIEHTYDQAFIQRTKNGNTETDDLTLDRLTPRRTIEKLQNVIIHISYFGAFPDGEQHIVECAAPTGVASSDLANPANLVTIRQFETAGPFSGRIKSIQNPDGTKQLYTYELLSGNRRKEVVDSLAAYWDLDPNKPEEREIIYGTRIATIFSATDQIESRITKALLFDGSESIVLASEISSDPDPTDPFQRPRRVDYLDGTYSRSTYGCCGLDTATDKDGTVTSYGYDTLKRLNSTSMNSVRVENTYDAAGNLLSTVRYPSDNSTATTLNSTLYDLAGRRRITSDAYGNQTRYDPIDSDPSVQVKTRTLYPIAVNGELDGGEKIETRNQDGSIQSITGSARFPVKFDYGVELVGGQNWTFTLETRLDANYNPTTQTIKTYSDPLHRKIKVKWPDLNGSPVEHTFEYNNKGQLWRETDPDGVVKIFRYNARGAVMDVAIDMERNPAKTGPNYTGDRIERVTKSIALGFADPTKQVVQTRMYVWSVDGSSTPFLSRVEEQFPGSTTGWLIRRAKNDQGTEINLITRTDVMYDTALKVRELKETSADGSFEISRFESGRLKSKKRHEPLPGAGLVSGELYDYDAHGRVKLITDLRVSQIADPILSTQLSYWDTDQVKTVTTPTPDQGVPALTETTDYDKRGRIWKITKSDNSVEERRYWPNGLLKSASGGRSTPVMYNYDAQGRLKTLQTWQNYAANSGIAVTTWNYDASRGWLISKVYPDNTGPTFPEYTKAGKLKKRLWQRGNSTTYTYNYAGEVETVTYLGTPITPNLIYSYDRLGRIRTITEGGIARQFAFNDLDQPVSESSGSISVESRYDGFFRRNRMKVMKAGTSTPLVEFNYTADSISRVQSINDGINTATFAYVSPSSPIDQVQLKNESTVRLTRKTEYDKAGRLKSVVIESGSPISVLGSYAYRYNSGSIPDKITWADGSYWSHQYDAQGHLRSSRRFWADGSIVAGQQFEYNHDDIGNRKSTGSGGDEWGGNLRWSNFTPNSKNQYDQRSVPGSVDVIGAANANAAVTVNNSRTARKAEYFRGEAVFDNETIAVNGQITTTAVLFDAAQAKDIISSRTDTTFIPKTPELPNYDTDGNLTTDGRWSYTKWDSENRLLEMESRSELDAARKVRLAFEYDAFGRRTRKTAYTWTGSSYSITPSLQRTFVYDGNNVIAELDESSNFVRGYAWGIDRSGSEQGAGGVGGLLWIKDAVGGTHYAACDGIGNVVLLVDNSNGSASATYEFGPFGEVIRVSGVASALNPFRFSSKYTDNESGMVFFGQRFYNPVTGRWLNRDPLQELGGPNLYVFALNIPTFFIDTNGEITFGEGLEIVGALGEGLGIGASNVGKAAWQLVKSPYTITKSVAEAQGYLSTQYGRETFGEALYMAGLLINQYASDPCFHERMNDMFGREAKDYFTNPYKLSELFTEIGVAAGTAGLGFWAKSADGAQKLARLAKLVDEFRTSGSAAERGIGKSLNAPNLFSVPNQGGGRVWLSTTKISQDDFARLVAAGQKEGRVTILTGTHGTPGGTLVPERAFFQEDLATWASQTHNVKLIDVTKLTPRQMQIVINRDGRVICAWCYSEKSIAVQSALEH
jgi:RHS repeat-associated protein